ncbi:unnamed protein product, partial [Phytomonas sp. Hart1]
MVWYALDRALVLPECVIEFSYMPGIPPMAAPMPGIAFAMPDALREELEGLFGCPYALPPPPTAREGDVVSESSEESHTERPSAETAPAAALIDANSPWVCVRECGSPLVAALHFFRTGLLEQITKTDVDLATTAARGILRLPRRSLNERADADIARIGTPTRDSTTEMPSAELRVLDGATIHDYCTQLGLPTEGKGKSGTSLVFCCLHRRSILALNDDFHTPLWGSLLTLDLSSNGIVRISFQALADCAPNLQYLFLQGNSISALDLKKVRFDSLYTLDLSYNLLPTVESLHDLPESFPKLQSLSVQKNPFIQREKNALLRLLSLFFCNPALVRSSVCLHTLNNVSLKAGNNCSYWGVLINRTLAVSALPSTDVLSLMFSWFSAAASFSLASLRDLDVSKVDSRAILQTVEDISKMQDPFSLDFGGIPERAYEATLAEVTASASEEVDHSPNSISARERDTTMADPLFCEGVLSAVESFAYGESLSRDLSCVLHLMPSLRHLTLRNHHLTDLSPFLALPSLEELNVQENAIEQLPNLTELCKLRRLDVSFNLITSLAEMGPVPHLQILNASSNALVELESDFLAQMRELEELYLASNQISSINSFYALKDLPKLISMDISGNPCMDGGGGTAPSNSSRQGSNLFPCYYVIYHFTNLKVLNGISISQEDLQGAHEEFAGRISADLLVERAHASTSLWGTLTELDLSHCMLKEVSMITAFPKLKLLKLNHNLLMQVEGVGSLRNLRALDLSFNRLGSLTSSRSLGEVLGPLTHLESLSLESNHITNLDALSLNFPKLYFLNLKSNELQYLDGGLEHLPRLIELIIDQNKLRMIGPECLSACAGTLTVLSAEENVIRTTDGLSSLKRLEQLYLGLNRLGDLQGLLSNLTASAGTLSEVVFTANPLTRKSNYRQKVVFAFQRLKSLDRRTVSSEDRRRAEQIKRNECVVPPNVFLDMGGIDNTTVNSSAITNNTNTNITNTNTNINSNQNNGTIQEVIKPRPLALNNSSIVASTTALPLRIHQSRAGGSKNTAGNGSTNTVNNNGGTSGADVQPMTAPFGIGVSTDPRTGRGITIPFPCVLRSLPVRPMHIPQKTNENSTQRNPNIRNTKYFYPGSNR